MNRIRAWMGWTLASCLALALHVGDARAAAEVHRFNIVFSGVPTTVFAQDFNERLGDFNRVNLESHGLQGLKEIRSAWLFDAQLRYFVRPNIAVEAGFGQLRQQSKQEFLPALNADIMLRTELLAAPVHVGAAYYLQPYNVGDFRAQAFFGGGFLSSFYNRARLQAVGTGLDSAAMVSTNFQVTGRGDSPGYYAEAGVHMFFAARFSMILSALYRSEVLRPVEGTFRGPDGKEIAVGSLAALPRYFPLGGLRQLDLSGVGARMAMAIGF